jgi:hypothetical protein
MHPCDSDPTYNWGHMSDWACDEHPKTAVAQAANLRSAVPCEVCSILRQHWRLDIKYNFVLHLPPADVCSFPMICNSLLFLSCDALLSEYLVFFVLVLRLCVDAVILCVWSVQWERMISE